MGRGLNQENKSFKKHENDNAAKKSRKRSEKNSMTHNHIYIYLCASIYKTYLNLFVVFVKKRILSFYKRMVNVLLRLIRFQIAIFKILIGMLLSFLLLKMKWTM